MKTSHCRGGEVPPFWQDALKMLVIGPVGVWIFCLFVAFAARLEDPNAYVPYWILAPLYWMGAVS